MISNQQLEELMRCGAVGMSVKKSCAIVEISDADFYASPEAQKAYRTGQYKGEYMWRQTVFRGAKEGVPQMCKLFQTLIQDTVAQNNPDIDITEYYQNDYPEIFGENHPDGTAGNPQTERGAEGDAEEGTGVT